MQPSTLWRSNEYHVGDYILQSRRHFFTDNTSLTIREKGRDPEKPPKPITRIIFDNNNHNKIWKVRRTNFSYVGGVPPRGDVKTKVQVLWPPAAKRR